MRSLVEIIKTLCYFLGRVRPLQIILHLAYCLLKATLICLVLGLFLVTVQSEF